MSLHARLLALEEQLLETATRANAQALADLLAEDFREFGSSGRIFDKGEIIAAMAIETPRQIIVHDFVCQSFSDDIALVTYSSQCGSLSSLRSSLWIKRQGCWKMVFHQGTRVPAEIKGKTVC